MRTSPRASRRRRRQAIIKTAVFAIFTACIITAGILIAQALTDKPTTPQKATESIEHQEPDPDPPEATSETTEAQSDTQSEATPPKPTYTYYDIPLADELQEYTQDLCREYGVSYELTLALMSAETDYRTNIISKTNDYGIMQINIINHERLTEALGVTDYLDPEQSIRAGIYMLSEISDTYDTPQEILMVYNRGHAGAKRLWSQGITTTKYTDKVLDRMNELKKR